MDTTGLDTRVAVLETKEEVIREALKDNKTEHKEILSCLQNHGDTLQDMKGSIDILATTTGKLNTEVCKLSKQQVEGDKERIQLSTKAKIVWGGLGLIVTLLVGIAIKSMAGCIG
jgi:chromosome segregation ATPase